MSRRAGALLAIAGLGLAGCGGGGGDGGSASAGGTGALRWKGSPTAYLPSKLLPRDRVVLGTVRNVSARTITLTAKQLRVRDARGRPLTAAGQFNQNYAHGVYGAFQKPDPIPPGELARLGLVRAIAPDSTAPFEIAYHLPPGFNGPVHVDYGSGTLPLPAHARPGAGVGP